MNPFDCGDVLAIEQFLPDRDRWTRAEIKGSLAHYGRGGIVAEVDGVIVGYAVYAYESPAIRLVKLVVDPHWRRQGFGRALLYRVRSRCAYAMNNRFNFDQVVALVRESDMDAAMFLKACIGRSRLARGGFGDHEDGYEFVFDPAPVAAAVA